MRGSFGKNYGERYCYTCCFIFKFLYRSPTKSSNIVGSHDELIKDPEGAFSQLIRLQEEANESEESQDIDPNTLEKNLDTDKSIARYGSMSQS